MHRCWLQEVLRLAQAERDGDPRDAGEDEAHADERPDEPRAHARQLDEGPRWCPGDRRRPLASRPRVRPRPLRSPPWRRGRWRRPSPAWREPCCPRTLHSRWETRPPASCPSECSFPSRKGDGRTSQLRPPRERTRCRAHLLLGGRWVRERPASRHDCSGNSPDKLGSETIACTQSGGKCFTAVSRTRPRSPASCPA